MIKVCIFNKSNNVSRFDIVTLLKVRCPVRCPTKAPECWKQRKQTIHESVMQTNYMADMPE